MATDGDCGPATNILLIGVASRPRVLTQRLRASANRPQYLPQARHVLEYCALFPTTRPSWFVVIDKAALRPPRSEGYHDQTHLRRTMYTHTEKQVRSREGTPGSRHAWPWCPSPSPFLPGRAQARYDNATGAARAGDILILLP